MEPVLSSDNRKAGGSGSHTVLASDNRQDGGSGSHTVLAKDTDLTQIPCEELSDCYFIATEMHDWEFAQQLDAELNRRIDAGTFLPEPE